MSTATPASRWKIMVAFGLVYVFWGSTYLGIGIAVEQIPPGFMCAVRFLIAGAAMLAYCALTGRRIRFSALQLSHFAAVGILLLMGGNLTLAYAERIVPTGLAALLIAVTPLWFLVLDSLLLGDHHISRRGKIGLAIGIVGVVVLIWPDLLHPNSLGRRELWWSLALQLGSFSWAFGSVLSKKWQTAAADPFKRDLDLARSSRDSVSRSVRFLDRLHRLHLAVAARSDFEGFYVRLRQSRGCSVSGMAGTSRAYRPLHCSRERDHHRVGGAGDEREGFKPECDGSRACGRGCGRLRSCPVTLRVILPAPRHH
jgi:hypothetical protein